ncbi:LOW QUALITY PROTEIN: carcinoembryonic antigen-related cell adhesion molecule 5-like [Cottoperca gobio]|uniref:LOW QUALITY PROTEIN: carcinoembryonic antigen-related cell adhesion molecule 5-like n=1 Tax=Cottoperca gobio TaxID=56716 RepID=A0A6J2RAA0_COTGO|nr:LOW QUALITY PROTEIN: carcinoembryonic antigen-related cell adhesion molecule 5-like [Cottoperca gobio]
MDTLTLLWIVSVAFTGLTKAAGVLPDGPLNAAVGETVTFSTTLTPQGTSIIAVTWTFDTKVIFTFSGANIPAPEYEGRITYFMSTGSLELRNVALNDSGEYTVSIIVLGESAKPGNTRLDVLVKVSNVVATASSTDLVEFNSSVSLSCSSSGSSLSFLWLNSSSEVTGSDRVQLTDGGSTLTINNVTRYDQGPFRCNVSNPVSSDISNLITFSISYGPENITLTKSLSQEYYVVGSNISLMCSAESRPPAQFQWFLNGDLRSDGAELRLMDIQESHSGNYSCQAFNSRTLRYITSQPESVTVLERISDASVTSTNLQIEGNSSKLTCDAAGSVFTRKWKKGVLDLTLTVNMSLSDNNRVLSFISLNKTDTGDYFCEISNPFSSEEATYFLVVNYGPENVKITDDSETTLNLTCSAESVPPASYVWMLNGTVIHNSAVFTENITDFSEDDEYVCEAMNNITGRKSSAVYRWTPTVTADGNIDCQAGCIAGIVLSVLLVVFCAAGAAGYYCHHTKKQTNAPSAINSATMAGGVEGQDNPGYSKTQELDYADIRFFQNKNGGTVQLGLQQNNPSEYAQVRVNNNPPAPSSPPTYDVHQQRMKRPAPQPDADATQLYARVQK